MRWLILLPAGPGALLGGWLGEHLALRASLLCAGVCGLLLALLAWHRSLLRHIDRLPAVSEESEMTPAVAWDQGRRLAEPETWS